MDKKLMQFIVLVLCCILLIPLSGCVKEQQQIKEILLPEIELGHPSILPNWQDGEYHDYYGAMDLLQEFQISYPDLVNVFSIGKSVLGKDIWCIRLTNEKNNQAKLSCLIDGCIHGSEWEAGEACLYLAEYLLINFDKNETITNILNSSEVNIVPLINPDGRQIDYRFNDNDIDLNRNFDIDFGSLGGCSIRLGKLFDHIKIPYIETPRLNKWLPKIFPPILMNCGRNPFSEPESQAIRDLMKELQNNDFSFYLNCHTSGLQIYSPWLAFKPPYEIPKFEQYFYDYVKKWIVDNTEYETGDTVYKSGGIIYKMSGAVIDWCYKEFRVPSFGIDFLSHDNEPYISGGKHDNLVHWMKTTLPVFMYLLVNIDNLRQWETPDIQPSLPEGVPPEPLK